MKKLLSDLGSIWKMLVKDIICLSWFLRDKGRVHFKRPFFFTYRERCATNACMMLLRTPHLVQYLSFYPTQLCKGHKPQLAAIAPLGEGLNRGTCQDMRPETTSLVHDWGWSILVTTRRKHLLLTHSVLCHFYTWMNNCSLKGSFCYAW